MDALPRPPLREIPQIISMETKFDVCYRMRCGKRIKYLVVMDDILPRNHATLLNPFELLPPLSYERDDWDIAIIFRDGETNELTIRLSVEKADGVVSLWQLKRSFSYHCIVKSDETAKLLHLPREARPVQPQLVNNTSEFPSRAQIPFQGPKQAFTRFQ
ncbi:hypothetical protein F4821DRAFT_257015 [Hypoxylon rubiginosum]|uniref:Uncharacterized protein n=1 Tax=Hypoxylon rubiginosum TaxID=110542 RepID=A0ACC0DAA7_9PEZI|nr:hypothetical protein F4821DRAFT_257015 [Hypoxylon rubiginosum]